MLINVALAWGVKLRKIAAYVFYVLGGREGNKLNGNCHFSGENLARARALCAVSPLRLGGENFISLLVRVRAVRSEERSEFTPGTLELLKDPRSVFLK